MTEATEPSGDRAPPSSSGVLASGDLLHRVLSSIDDHFVMLDREWRYVYLNDRMLQDSGQSAEELTGHVVWDVHPGLVGSDYELTARRAVAEQRPARVTFHYTPRDKWFEVQFYPSPEGVAILASDVTGQMVAERSLAQRVTELGALYEFSDRLQRIASCGELYDAALDAMRDALGARRASILLFDAAGVMRFVAWRGLSDEYRAAVDGHSPWTQGEPDATPIWVEDVDAAGLEPWLQQRLAGEGIRALGFVPLIADGRLIGKFMLYHDTFHATLPEENALALTIARQLASAVQRQRVEQERQASAAALREANQRKDEFLSTLAHELRNPLAPIVSMLAVLQQQDEDPALRAKGRAVIDRQVRHLVRLVDDLLDVARINHNRLELRRELVDLGVIVLQAVEGCRPTFESLNHTLVVSVPDHPVELYADPVRLAQVVCNLLNNAAKYTAPGGHITVEAQRRNGHAVIAVRDDGIGIPAEMLDQVFEPFRQLGGTLERSHGGLGIGLTLVKRLVEMHGGVVEVASDGAGKGSAFTVQLPIAPAATGTADS